MGASWSAFGSISQRHGSADPDPDPHQNVMDPQHWFKLLNFFLLVQRTTLEQFRAPIFHDNVCDKNGWSLGKMNNLREVMGLFPGAWCLPIPTQVGDGLSFPHARAQQHGTMYNTMPGRSKSQAQGGQGFHSVDTASVPKLFLVQQTEWYFFKSCSWSR